MDEIISPEDDQRTDKDISSDWKSDFCVRKGEGVENGQRFKWFQWGDNLTAGHCFMYPNAKLTIREDGSASWNAATQSRDEDDEWNSKFDFFASDGSHLFTMPSQEHGGSYYFNSMENANRAYEWHKEWSYKRKDLFDHVANAKMDYRC